jgi:hypothetical protein
MLTLSQMHPEASLENNSIPIIRSKNLKTYHWSLRIIIAVGSYPTANQMLTALDTI